MSGSRSVHSRTSQRKRLHLCEKTANPAKEWRFFIARRMSQLGWLRISDDKQQLINQKAKKSPREGGQTVVS
jgi:hypothetical protein